MNEAREAPMEYLTVNEVCARRKCSRSTLYEEIKRSKKSGGMAPMPYPFRWGRRTYFVAAEVDEWLRAIVANARNQE